MIELKDIRRSYKTGSFEQTALDGVSITFRANEFVAVLGPSGSGKTTLLNILGGLDHADAGELVINGVSTSRYKSHDWDTYRNHHIGFIFQSYNLIPHQTILSNVELALTLSGVPREERHQRAIDELVKVGLGDHIDKKPNQLSGGQMQRVAIARALINDPDIVLADEPTGALDTETGVQVMDLLSEIARDRLVIMVTHNPDLAQRYANRIVNLSDGRITGDSNPYNPTAAEIAAAAAHETNGEPAAAMEAVIADVAVENAAAAANVSAASSAHATADASADAEDASEDAKATGAANSASGKGRKKYASMNFLTALSLSFNNLMTKKGRTFLTAFAGSIGIMGIAAILALSNGVNNYIAKVEEDTLSSYPLSISKSSYDFSKFFTENASAQSDSSDSANGSTDDSSTTVSATTIPERTMVTDMFAQIKNNDLSAFKSFLEGGQSNVDDYVNAITYSYGITPQVYKNDTSNGVVRLNPSSMSSLTGSSVNSSTSFGSSSFMNTDIYQEMMDDSALLDSQYDVVSGHWPENYDECVLVLSKNGTVSDYTLYNIGVLDPDQLKDMAQKALNSEKVDVPDNQANFTYDDALNTTFKVVNSCNLYRQSDSGTWTDMSDDTDYMTQQIENGTTLKIVGVVKPDETTSSPALSQGIAYTSGLTQHLMDESASSAIVEQQKADSGTDVFTGKTFDELQSENGASLDMSSLFSIDTNAINNAMTLDAGSTGGSSTSLDSSSLTAMMKTMPQPDFSKISPALSKAQQTQIASDYYELIYGFFAYYFQQNPAATINAATVQDAKFQAAVGVYLQSDSALSYEKDIASIIGTTTASSVQSIMTDYMTNSLTPWMQKVMTQMTQQVVTAMTASVQEQTSAMATNLSNTLSSAITFNMSQEDLTSLLSSYMNADSLTYDSNLTKLGYAEKNNPSSIDIYPIDFKNKEKVLSVIDDYNQQMKDEGKTDQVISYTDIMGTLMSSVTDIVNMISLVLIAFVSISLVVSSIMIGIITYISVLERKKEIGILRAIGASKRNIANVFNAETVIEGFIAGVFAIAVVIVASILVNAIVLSVYKVENVMSLPWYSALILIGISVFLTFIAGLIPSTNASRRDPVEALRSE